jgi:hypothetical protein
MLQNKYFAHMMRKANFNFPFSSQIASSEHQQTSELSIILHLLPDTHLNWKNKFFFYLPRRKKNHFTLLSSPFFWLRE